MTGQWIDDWDDPWYIDPDPAATRAWWAALAKHHPDHQQPDQQQPENEQP